MADRDHFFLVFPNDSGHRPAALGGKRGGFPDDLLDGPEGKCHRKGEAEKGAERVVHHREKFFQRGGEVIPPPWEKDDAAPSNPNPGELPPDQAGQKCEVKETGLWGVQGGKEALQVPLCADQGPAVDHPDENPAPANPDGLCDRNP